MSKQIFAKEYEEYLITGKEESLNSLVNGSIEKDYILLIKKIQSENLTEELQEEIETFLEKIPQNQSYRLKALNLFKQLKEFPDNKKKIIQEIKSLFGIRNVKYYDKPIKYNKELSNTEENESSSQKIPNSLNISTYVQVDKFINDIYSNTIDPNNDTFTNIFGSSDINLVFDFNKIPEDLICKILTNKKEYKFIYENVAKSISFAKMDHFKKVFKKIFDDDFLKEEEIKKEFETSLKNYISYFLNEQIEALLEYKKKLNLDMLVSELIQRKYYQKLDDPNEKIKKLKEIKKLLNEYQYKDEKMTREVLMSLLTLNSKMNIYDLDLFIEYIQCPLFINPSLYKINKELENKIKANSRQRFNFSCQIIRTDQSEEEEEIIEKHLQHFFLVDKLPYEKFNKFFNEDYLRKLFAKMQFYSGDEKASKNEILSNNEIQNLANEIKLSICDYNKKIFGINDDVELVLEIKNIQKLNVNIYEINTENYYFSNNRDFNRNISLDGIVPTYEDLYAYKDNPQLLLEKKIKIDKLPKKRGLFIIEFIGKGHVSRAVIQRGNLKCIHKNTYNGKVLYILDEDNNLCKGENTGIWINNIWYPSIVETGAILIPYSVNNGKFILKHNDFCRMEINITIPPENYDFKGMFIINEESFIMGNVATVLVRPYLFVCDELCPFTILKNIKLTINAYTKENNQSIPTMNIIDDVELSYDKEFSFDFPIPARLESVNFLLSAEVQPKTRDGIEKLSFQETFDFIRVDEFDTLVKQNSNGNYLIYLLGKNGEPKINKQINLKLEHKNQSKINDGNPILMETDFEGSIDIGKLKNMKNFIIFSKRFSAEQLNYTYLSTMTILENQQINLPLSKNCIDSYKLIKFYNGKYLENLTELIKLEVTDKKYELYNITLPKLTEGIYKLMLDEKQITIYVIKGKEMDIKDFIITSEGSIRYATNKESSIALQNVCYNNNELKIKINKNQKSQNFPRIHINCVQYKPKQCDKNLNNFYKTQFLNQREINDNKCFNFHKVENVYLNNKILSDEMQYVIDRKQYETKLGNSLEKPSLLLKPQYIRDTTTEIKKGEKERGFGVGGVNECAMKCAKRMMAPRSGCRSVLSQIYIHDFINVSPLIKTNLVPDENGEIIIKDIDLSEYSFLHILCFDNISCCEDCFLLQKGKTSLRDLRAVKELEYNKNYCEFRKTYPLAKNDKYKIKDITSVKYKIFDSLEKYIEFLKIVNPSLNTDFQKFEFLLNFGNLKLPEKLDKITTYFSHEINIYLYFHHNDFFNQYIYPILKYKSEKTFIDYFLLEDQKHISEYTEVQKIQNLNTFEKCLLIYSIRKENKSLARSIARQIRSECSKENQNEIKRLFNIALNLKSIEETITTATTTAMKKVEMKVGSRGPFPHPHLPPPPPGGPPMPFPMPMMCGGGPSLGFASCALNSAPRSFGLKKMPFEISDELADRINIKAKLFQEEGKSQEFCETHYYNKVFESNNSKDYIRPNHFFADLAQFWTENTDSKRNIGFVTDNLLSRPDNFTQAIFMLSVLDLEEKTLPQSQNLIKDKGLGLTIEANVNSYILTKELNETQLNDDNKYALILAQVVYEENMKSNEDEEEKEVTKFLTERTYLQKTIVTNISSNLINCEILMHIPEGSIPIGSGEYNIIENANINSYQSVIFEQRFYFPIEGTYNQYPSSASINNLVIAKSGVKTYEVFKSIKLSKEEIKSIDDVLNLGNKNQILEFIKKSDTIEIEDLGKIYWMLKDEDFYKQIVNILKEKYIFDENIWEYSLKYKDIETLQEFILYKGQKEILSSIGHEIDLLFLKLDSTNNAHILNHLDYYPILNSRVFKLPKAESILTLQFRNTYQNYISYLITLPEIKDNEYMRLCYYLILQQRIKEATIIYNKINKQNIIGNDRRSLELQYDYLTAYLDFCNGYPKFEKAREISKKYKEISIKIWKNMFKEIEDQLNEYDDKASYNELITDEEKSSQEKNKQKAKSEEVLSIEIIDQDISIIYKNISEITIKYYLIDIEILFSRKPFMKKANVDFNYVKPQKIETIKLNKESKENKFILKVPSDLINKNFLLEVSSGKIIENEVYYSSLLKCSIIESIGEIKVMTPELKPLPKVYVKCFCETKDGQEKFYKDGFTDLRGKFDYLSLNNDLINNVNKFSILMISKQYGSIIKVCEPPKLIKDGNDNLEKIFELRQKLRNQNKK